MVYIEIIIILFTNDLLDIIAIVEISKHGKQSHEESVGNHNNVHIKREVMLIALHTRLDWQNLQ